MSALLQPRVDLRRPFTRAQARAAGISDGVLRGPRFQRLAHGIYLSSAVTVTARLRLEAVLLVHPASAYASHASAGRVYGSPQCATISPHPVLECGSCAAYASRRSGGRPARPRRQARAPGGLRDRAA